MKRFDELDVSDALKLIRDGLDGVAFTETQNIYEGDLWLAGKGFKDTKLPPGHYASKPIEEGIESIFVAQNLVKEVTDRRTDALLSRMPRMGVRINPEDEDPERERKEEKRRVLYNWFIDKGVREKLKTLATTVTLHKEGGVLRMRVPPGRLENGAFKGATVAEVLDDLFIEVHRADEAKVVEDRHSARKVGMVHFPKPSDLEPVFSEVPTTASAEFTYNRVTPDGQTLTVLKIAYEDETADQVVDLDIGGNLLHHHAKHDEFITRQVKDANFAIDTTITMLLFANRETNFQQRIYGNVQPLGKLEVDDDTGEEVFVPDPIERGPDKDLFLAGLVEYGPDGEVRYKDTQVHALEVGTAERFIATIRELRLGLYRQTRQLHMEITDDATSTGEARMQAAADHEQDLSEFKLVIESAGLWALDTAWRIAQYVSGEELDDPAELFFETILDLGPIAASRRASVVQEVQIHLKSRQTGMAEIGVQDPAHEMELVEKEMAQDLERKQLMLEILDLFQTLGLEVSEDAIRWVGIPENLATVDTNPPQQ